MLGELFSFPPVRSCLWPLEGCTAATIYPQFMIYDVGTSMSPGRCLGQDVVEGSCRCLGKGVAVMGGVGRGGQGREEKLRNLE